VENVLLAKLVCLNSQHMDFGNSKFNASHMTTRMADGRSKVEHLIPHHETVSTTIQPPYSSTKG
jgi:hypothetical protein